MAAFPSEAVPVEKSVAISPDGRFDLFLSGEENDAGNILYFHLAARDTTSKKLVPLGEENEFNLDGAFSLSSTEASWSPDSSMVILSVQMYRGRPNEDIILRWDGSKFVHIHLPDGVLPERWIPPNQLICAVTRESICQMDLQKRKFVHADKTASESSAAIKSFLVKTGTWAETWLDAEGKEQVRDVKGELWNEAIQEVLARQGRVHLPARREPYYLDEPIILQSGQSLTADPSAEIRLKPGVNTCMIRNEHVVGFNDRPAPADLVPDTDITIEGGIWTTLANGVKGSNGNPRGASSQKNPVPGTHGVILLHNVRHVSVKNITVRQSKAFAVHLGIARDFIVDGVTLDRHERDGVHLHGPSSDGIIRNIHGDSHDDTVALNAWDWSNYIPTYGPIHHITIENVSGAPTGTRSADSIRLLPGVKRFSDGATLDCSISDITIRNITDVREFKFYDQPNLELGRDKDFSFQIGKLRNIRLEHLTFTRPGVIQIASDVDGLTVEDVNFTFTPSPAFKLIEVGPMSATYRHGKDPAQWVEIFSPDRDVTVRGIQLGAVRVNNVPVVESETKFISVKDQHINPDYPKTTPRGGTGKALHLP